MKMKIKERLRNIIILSFFNLLIVLRFIKLEKLDIPRGPYQYKIIIKGPKKFREGFLRCVISESLKLSKRFN